MKGMGIFKWSASRGPKIRPSEWRPVDPKGKGIYQQKKLAKTSSRARMGLYALICGTCIISIAAVWVFWVGIDRQGWFTTFHLDDIGNRQVLRDHFGSMKMHNPAHNGILDGAMSRQAYFQDVHPIEFDDTDQFTASEDIPKSASDKNDNTINENHQETDDIMFSDKNSYILDTIPELGGLVFTDAEEYINAPNITVPDVPQSYEGKWHLQAEHDKFFKDNVHKLWVPHLDQAISRKTFHEIFRKTGTPVVLNFKHLRKLGVLSTTWTIGALRKKFPYTQYGEKELEHLYTRGSGTNTTNEMNLGPALYALENNFNLSRQRINGKNAYTFPRNIPINSRWLSVLDVSSTPFVPPENLQPATLWMGTTTADTRLHHDCCDNFASMLAGIKRWFLVPPPGAHKIQPIFCEGAHHSLCWGNGLKYPNKAESDPKLKKILENLEYVKLDLYPGEMLYLPAGWWHHVENIQPTIMVNQWTQGCSSSAVALTLDPDRADRPDLENCSKTMLETEEWIK